MSHATIIAAHYRALSRRRGVAAVLSRGDATCDVEKVVLGRADSEAVTTKESRLAKDVQDIIVRVSDYKPTGPVSAPLKGDKLVATVADEVLTFEVRPPSGSQDHCRHADSQTKLYWRLFTKITKREPVV